MTRSHALAIGRRCIYIDSEYKHTWAVSDCNRIGTHNHLVRKRTLSHLPKVGLNG